MQILGRLRAADLAPIGAVAAATAILLLVALSIVLQPPAAASATGLDRALGWARALLFTAGAAAFLIGIIGFARAVPAGEDAEDVAEQGRGIYARSEPLPRAPRPTVPARANPLRRSAAPKALAAAGRVRPTPSPALAPPALTSDDAPPRAAEPQRPRFTLLAVGDGDDDVRAVAGFDDARALLDAMRGWSRAYPSEEQRVFAADGVLLGRRLPGPEGQPAPTETAEPIREPSPAPLWRRTRLAMGGA